MALALVAVPLSIRVLPGRALALAGLLALAAELAALATRATLPPGRRV